MKPKSQARANGSAIAGAQQASTRILTPREQEIFAKKDELDLAVRQATAMNELLKYHITHPDEDGEPFSEYVQCGIIDLCGETFNRRRRASERVFAEGGAR